LELDVALPGNRWLLDGDHLPLHLLLALMKECHAHYRDELRDTSADHTGRAIGGGWSRTAGSLPIRR
jgi:hypothetical protein